MPVGLPSLPKAAGMAKLSEKYQSSLRDKLESLAPRYTPGQGWDGTAGPRGLSWIRADVGGRPSIKQQRASLQSGWSTPPQPVSSRNFPGPYPC
ncbi:hypothetical protein GGTG_05421 [Gaeumannomyces tritici R3-111a-1]|uniref:Uncharacterized protein n=1 Tax=Gaeumannomyces tritici (strain R3-111a-1) TaxID=644352 RepID=J3NVV9_GAET3|nr:hypothetical protein GGTG_05421 [Gaeumannomyces tritici R3-111a-1]EJT75488.1 hypothetical protein GGTG_05421 [Gaeumannomyces tritici R3-111a-1]